MTSSNNDKQMTFQEKTIEMHQLSNDIQKLYADIRSYRGRLSWERKGMTGDNNNKLEDIMKRVIALGDQETFNTFQLCFGQEGLLKSFYTNQTTTGKEHEQFNDTLKHSLNGFKEAFDNKVQEEKGNKVRRGLATIQNKFGGNKLSTVANAFQHGAGVSQDMIDNANQPIEAVDIYVNELNKSVAHLAQLEIVLTTLVKKESNKKIEEFRNYLKDTQANLTNLLTNPQSTLMSKSGSSEVRLQEFLQSQEFRALQYALAELKFRFTHEIQLELNNTDNFKKYAGVLGIKKGENKTIYDAVRDMTGFKDLQSNKDLLKTLEQTPVDPSVKEKVNTILNYMDGVVSVWALVEKNKNQQLYFEISKTKNIQGIVNGILLGLDPDLGLDAKLKERFTNKDGLLNKKAYNAFVGGCIEECMVKNRPDIFKRSEEIRSLGKFIIDKKNPKLSGIKNALGLSVEEQPKEHFEFIELEKLKSNDLQSLYDSSKDKFHKKFGGQMPIYLLLAAIKPLKVNKRTNITALEAKQIEEKVSIYQTILDTLKIGWGFPGFGRARVALDNTQSLGLKEEARGMFDRILHFYQTHQPEIAQLKPATQKAMQDRNRELFHDFDTFFITRGLKSMGHDIGRWLLSTLNATPNAYEVSDQNLRQMQYKHLKGKTLEDIQTDGEKLDLKGGEGRKHAKFLESKDTSISDAYMRGKIDSQENIHKKTKLEKIYDNLKLHDDIQDIRLIKDGLTIQFQDAEELKKAVREKYLAECEARYAAQKEGPHGVEQDFSNYKQLMDIKFEKAYELVDRIPDYITKYESASPLLRALDMQKDIESELHEEKNKQLLYEGLKKRHAYASFEDTDAYTLMEEKLKTTKVLASYTTEELKDMSDGLIDKLINGEMQYKEVLKSINDITKILNSREDGSTIGAEVQNSFKRASVSFRNGIVPSEEQYVNPNTNSSALSAGGAQGVNHPNSTSSINSGSLFKKPPPPPPRQQQVQTLDNYLRSTIEPLQRERNAIFSLPVDDETDAKFDSVEHQLNVKRDEWNNAHPDERFDFDDNFNVNRPGPRLNR